jgi:hypothetical protein
MFECARALVWQNLVVLGDGHDAGMPRHSGLHELGLVPRPQDAKSSDFVP